MVKFDPEKVRKVAIDKPNHKQIYVLDHNHQLKVIQTLIQMGFRSDPDSLSLRYAHLPLVVNTNERFFFTVGSAGIMACAGQCGAKVLSYAEMMGLLTI